MKKCPKHDAPEGNEQIERLLIANGIPPSPKATPDIEVEAVRAYKEVLDLLAEIIADDYFKRNRRDAQAD